MTALSELTAAYEKARGDAGFQDELRRQADCFIELQDLADEISRTHGERNYTRADHHHDRDDDFDEEYGEAIVERA